MRLLKFSDGSVIYDHEIKGQSVRINGQVATEILPVNDITVQENLGVKYTDLLDQERNFKMLQKKRKR